MSIIALLIWILIAILVVSLALYAVTLLPDPPVSAAAKNLMKLAIILVVLIILIGWLAGGFGPGPHLVRW